MSNGLAWNEIREIKVQVDTDTGMELKMFENSEGKICVRLRDIDAKENVGLIKCINLEQAEEKWIKWGGK